MIREHILTRDQRAELERVIKKYEGQGLKTSARDKTFQEGQKLTRPNMEYFIMAHKLIEAQTRLLNHYAAQHVLHLDRDRKPIERALHYLAEIDSDIRNSDTKMSAKIRRISSTVAVAIGEMSALVEPAGDE